MGQPISIFGNEYLSARHSHDAVKSSEEQQMHKRLVSSTLSSAVVDSGPQVACVLPYPQNCSTLCKSLNRLAFSS